MPKVGLDKEDLLWSIDMSEVKKLPIVENVQGVHFGPHADLVALQFKSGDDTYELCFEFSEFFKMEEFFIKVRQRLGGYMQERLRNTAP